MIATLLLILITVAAAAALYFFVNQYQLYAQKQIGQPTVAGCPGNLDWATNSSSLDVSVPIDANLISAAQAEGGTLSWITTTGSYNVTQVDQAFTCDFPWAKLVVDPVTSGSNILTAVDGQFASGDHTIDVVSSGISTLVTLDNTGYIQNFPNPVAAVNYPAGSYTASGEWTTLYSSYYGIAYNTQVLTGSAIPTSWQALTAPAFNNELAMDTSSSSAPGAASLGEAVTSFAGLSLGMSNASWQSLMNGIAANSPIFASSGSSAIQDTVLGTKEVAVGVLLSDTQQAEATGAPVTFEYLNPTPATISAISILQNCPHPAMAELFTEWMASLHGQAAWSHVGRVPVVNPGGATTVPAADSVVQVTNIYSSTAPNSAYYWYEALKPYFGSSE